MKAARFYNRRDIRVETIADPPEHLAPGQVLISNNLCGICGTDLHEYIDGPIFVPREPHPYSGAQLPLVLGHEFGGRVVAVGAAVTSVKPGDRVSVQPHIAPRDDYYGRRGQYQLSDDLAIAGLSWAWGGFGEYAVLNDYNTVPIPDAVTDVQAALVEPAAVAVYAVTRAGVRPGDKVLVTGAGPIGQLVAMAAQAAGASLVLLSDTNDNRLTFARGILSGVITVNPMHDNLVEQVRDHTESGTGVDVAIECAGHSAPLGNCIEAVRRQGVVVQLGLHVDHASVDAFALARKDIDLRGSWCYSTLMWPRVASLLASGQLPAEKIVTRRIALADIVADGFEALIAQRSTQIKILVEVGKTIE